MALATGAIHYALPIEQVLMILIKRSLQLIVLQDLQIAQRWLMLRLSMQLLGQGLIQQQSPEPRQHVGVTKNLGLPKMFQPDGEADLIWKQKMIDTNLE
jgi:hypothetical protein